ncbi:MAG: hypothetical protein A3J75_02380 [Acidobacteria bacterium RBG_16_68_9]|nr:MAG: hypothetical protein A3J75_02380 [Acidobacteria bacterium RBG_16_68_9]
MPGKAPVIAGARYLAFGLEFAVIVIVGVVLGYHADRHLGTEPWLMLVLTLGGLYGALRCLLWSLKKHS